MPAARRTVIVQMPPVRCESCLPLYIVCLSSSGSFLSPRLTHQPARKSEVTSLQIHFRFSGIRQGGGCHRKRRLHRGTTRRHKRHNVGRIQSGSPRAIRKGRRPRRRRPHQPCRRFRVCGICRLRWNPHLPIPTQRASPFRKMNHDPFPHTSLGSAVGRHFATPGD